MGSKRASGSRAKRRQSGSGELAPASAAKSVPPAQDAPSPPQSLTRESHTTWAAGRVRHPSATSGDEGRFADLLHRCSTDTGTYVRLLRGIRTAVKELDQTSHTVIERYLDDMAPRDQVERMLAMQMLWQHLRIARLCQEWSMDELSHRGAVLSAAISDGMELAQRQAKTWRRIRSESLASPQASVAIGQVNIASQRLVYAPSLTGPNPGR